jgi:hypothetical protein
MGYENRDCNGASQTGFMLPQATIRRGARCSQIYYLHFVEVHRDEKTIASWKREKS